MEYKPYQSRVVDEYRELKERINKLKTFFYKEPYWECTEEERFRLHIQYTFMCGYSEVLEQRISNFNK